jgi:hypothetical protein
VSLEASAVQRGGEQADGVRGALVARDLMDAQLVSADRRRIARVADVVLEPNGRGGLRVAALEVGPQAVLGRLSTRLRAAAERRLGDRFLHRIDVGEIDEVGITVRLTRRASEYAVAGGDRWTASRILRHIPGHGRASR